MSQETVRNKTQDIKRYSEVDVKVYSPSALSPRKQLLILEAG
jgi:hypothetical protein